MQTTQTTLLPQNWEATLSKILAKTWIDESFRQRFIQEPLAVLEEVGLALEDSIKVIVDFNSATADGIISVISEKEEITIYQVDMPSKPSGLEEEKINYWYSILSGKGSTQCCIRACSS